MRQNTLSLIIIVFVLFCNTTLQGQSTLPDEIKVTFVAEEIPLSQALKDLSNKSGVNIAFSEELVSNESPVSISARNKPLGYVLSSMLAGTDIKYRIIGNQLVLEQDRIVEAVSDVINVSGYVYDIDTGESLPYANIYSYDKLYGATSNDYGFYSISLPKGENHLYYSYIGYTLDIVDCILVQDTVVSMALRAKTKLNEVVIFDTEINTEENSATTLNLPVKQLSAMVPLAGEADVLRYMQQVSGVTTGADGVGGMSVRGGNVEHNLILLDGVPMYELNHALGLFSVFNNYAVKNTVFYKDGMPAKLGGRLASVLDIRTKEGNINDFGGEVGISTITAKASIEGPIEKGKSSFILSGRRTILDPFINSLSNGINQVSKSTGDRNYSFYDIFGKLSFKVSEKSNLYVTLFNGGDNFLSNSQSQSIFESIETDAQKAYTWDSRNTLVSTKWNYQKNKNTFIKLGAYFTNYGLQVFDLNSLQIIESQLPVSLRYQAKLHDSGISDFGLKLDIDKIQASGNILSYGLEAINHSFSPGILLGNEESQIPQENTIPESRDYKLALDGEKIGGQEMRGYVQYELKFNGFSRLNVGLHQSLFLTEGGANGTYAIPEPRLSLLLGKEAFQFRVSVNRMSQFSHRISYTSIGWPLDIWLPSTDKIGPQKSWLGSLGLKKKVSKSTSLGIEGFYRYFTDIISYNAGGNLIIGRNSNWEALVPVGNGQSYGMEVYLEKNLGKLLLNSSYTLSTSTRQFEDLNNGNVFRHRYDRRHSLKLNLLYRINNNAEFAMNWLYGSGSPISVPSFITVEEDGAYRFIFDELNGQTLRDFHRLDIGFNFYNTFKWGRLKFNIGAYNVYNRSNPYYIDIIPQNTGLLREYSILPVVPSVSISLQF